jgi:transposase-like protein
MKKIIFVDETLLKVDGIEYWIWIAYEPKLNSYLMMLYLSKEGRFSSYVTGFSSS